ncbi:hypothetical protein QF038_002876 [Pseudarthrobacter sp. W1I19]|uniref:hypothetical protein n=1 Tax=Pseudarthrobacter sp. W1I19 TaxID=3042288 RepID=UPI0027845625|nr:hypothetical protein [Pseudarthrobacter sp. W1I19]MDQ0924368.1 hypothetical protein [Pseudarthrobacter sp. W1I19]
MATWDSRHRTNPDSSSAAADPAMFRNLCRSSPWKWQSLRFEYWDEPFAEAPSPAAPPVRAWLRRPGALRLETADGLVLHSTTGINDSKDGLYVSATRKSWLLPPHLVTPVYDDQGLVRRRPEAAYGEPGFGNGRFSAALDPVELAGNAPVPIEFPGSNRVEVHEVSHREHEGRPVLEAVVAPTAAYHPIHPPAPLCLPGKSRVRVDLATGVCVASQSLEPGTEEYGHWLRIIAVDEYMLDDLFVAESMSLTDVRQHISWEIPA